MAKNQVAKLSASQGGALFMGTMPDDLASFLAEQKIANAKDLKNIARTRAAHNDINRERSGHAIKRRLVEKDDFGKGMVNPFASAIRDVVIKLQGPKSAPASKKSGKKVFKFEVDGAEVGMTVFPRPFPQAFDAPFALPFAPVFA